MSMTCIWIEKKTSKNRRDFLCKILWKVTFETAEFGAPEVFVAATFLDSSF